MACILTPAPGALAERSSLIILTFPPIVTSLQSPGCTPDSNTPPGRMNATPLVVTPSYSPDRVCQVGAIAWRVGGRGGEKGERRIIKRSSRGSADQQAGGVSALHSPRALSFRWCQRQRQRVWQSKEGNARTGCGRRIATRCCCCGTTSSRLAPSPSPRQPGLLPSQQNDQSTRRKNIIII